MKIKSLSWITVLVFLSIGVGSVLRLWKLGSIPPHLTPDEASLGYNAFSILKTAKDEYGELLPIIFKSFGDYKPGLYVYLTVPFVYLFGLTEFAVRLPAALAGIIAIWFVYKIALLLLSKKAAAVSALILAINPWHIHFSRGAWEITVSLTLTLAGIYFFLYAKKRVLYLTLSALMFSLTFITYQGAKLSTGIVVILLAICFWNEVKTFRPKKLFLPVFVALIVSWPVLLSFFNQQTGRLTVFSVFSYPRPRETLENFLNQGNEKYNSISYYLYHSEALNYARGILARWFNHFSARFLFIEGDWSNPRHAAPYHGMFIILDSVFIILGFAALVKNKLNRNHMFILLWLILAPLPAILSRDQVHAVRSFNLVIPLVWLSSLGLSAVLQYRRIMAMLFILYIANYLYFLDAYFIHMPKHYSRQWEYGYKQIVEYVSPIRDQYKEIRVQQSYAQPYIYFLFYERYDPVKYQQIAYLVPGEYKGDVGKVEHLDNIVFGPIDWSVRRGDKNVIFVADLIRIPAEDSNDPNQFILHKEIKYLNGLTAFRILEVK